jgi:hypothetical protein
LFPSHDRYEFSERIKDFDLDEIEDGIKQRAVEYAVLLSQLKQDIADKRNTNYTESYRTDKLRMNAFFKLKETPRFNKYFKALLKTDEITALSKDDDALRNRVYMNQTRGSNASEVNFRRDDINFLVALARRYEKLTSKAKKSGGRVPNAGKPLPKRQLQSFKKKLPSKPRTKKNSAWMAHLAEFRKANPSIAAKDMMKAAKQTYKSGGAHCGGELVLQQDGGASIKPDIKMTEDTHTMPDGTIMSGKSHSSEIKKLVAAKTAGNVPTAPEKMAEKSDQDQSKIMVDIMNSYDEFNKRFEDISNSNATRS